MVMDTVAELNLLEIFQESLVFGVILVSGITGIYFFEKLAQGEIVTTVLVPEDVAPLEGGFRQIIYEFLLIEREILETGHYVA